DEQAIGVRAKLRGKLLELLAFLQCLEARFPALRLRKDFSARIRPTDFGDNAHERSLLINNPGRNSYGFCRSRRMIYITFPSTTFRFLCQRKVFKRPFESGPQCANGVYPRPLGGGAKRRVRGSHRTELRSYFRKPLMSRAVGLPGTSQSADLSHPIAPRA